MDVWTYGRRLILTSSGSFGLAVDLDTDMVAAMSTRNLGSHVDFECTKFSILLMDLHRCRYKMFGIGWIADYPDSKNFLDIPLFSETSHKRDNYDSPDIDALAMEG